MDNEVDARLPAGCPTCHGAIAPERVEDQDQEEIGRRVHVTRFRVHIGHYVACGTRVQGRHPSQTSEATGAAAAQVGPEALAFAAILNQEFGLSYGKTVAVRQRGFGLTLTPGGLSQALARLAARCEPTDEHRKAVVRTQPSVTLDETGWRIGGHPAWLHVAATRSRRSFRRTFATTSARPLSGPMAASRTNSRHCGRGAGRCLRVRDIIRAREAVMCHSICMFGALATQYACALARPDSKIRLVT